MAPSPLQDGSLAKWQLVQFNISQLTARCGEAVRPRQQGGAALQEHVDAGPGAVDVRPRARSRSSTGSSTKFAKTPELAEANIAALNAGHAYGETRRDRRADEAAPHRRRPGRAGPLPHRHRRGIALARPRRRRAAGRPADVLRRLSDHPGLGDPPSPVAAQGISASPPSRRRTRSPRSAPRSARPMPGSWASPPRRARASRSRARRWAWRS